MRALCTNTSGEMLMKCKKLAILLSVMMVFGTILTGCGDKVLTGKLNGKWAYIHDTKTAALTIKDNGKATLDKKNYTCEYDDDYIYLTDKNGNVQKNRYILEKEDSLLLYKTATYKYQGTGTSDGLIGVWIDTDNGNSSFEFTTEGTFREDSYMPGYYYVDEEAGSILLVYNDHYIDTTIYYSLDGDILTVDYPWTMTRMGK